MPRVKRGVTAHARHKKIIAQAKGYRGRRKNVFRIAKQAVIRAGQMAYRDRASESASSAHCGSCASMPQPANTDSRTVGSWMDSARRESQSIARYWPRWRSPTRLHLRTLPNRQRPASEKLSIQLQGDDEGGRPHVFPLSSYEDLGMFDVSMKSSGTRTSAIARRRHLPSSKTCACDFSDGRAGSPWRQEPSGHWRPNLRPEAGRRLNDGKKAIRNTLEARKAALSADALQSRLASERLDVSLPGRGQASGGLHPVTRTWREDLLAVSSHRIRSRGRAGARRRLPQLRSPQHSGAPSRTCHADTFYFPDGNCSAPTPRRCRYGSCSRAAPSENHRSGRVYRCDSDQTHTRCSIRWRD